MAALTYHFEYPHLVGVGYGEAFALGGVTVQLHEGGHDADGLAGGAAALQGQGDEAGVVDDTRGVVQFLASAEGGFGDGHLVLVDVAHHGISLFGLGYEAHEVVVVAVDDAAHVALGVACGGQVDEPAVHAVVVLVVSDEG